MLPHRVPLFRAVYTLLLLNKTLNLYSNDSNYYYRLIIKILMAPFARCTLGLCSIAARIDGKIFRKYSTQLGYINVYPKRHRNRCQTWKSTRSWL